MMARVELPPVGTGDRSILPTRAMALASAAMLAVLVLRPLVAPLVLAGLAAVLARPMQRRLEGRLGRGSNRAALLSLFVVVFGAGGPLIGLSMLIVVQLRRLAADFLGMPPGHTIGSRMAQLIDQGLAALGAVTRRYLDGRLDIERLARQRLGELGDALSEGFTGLASTTGQLAFYALVLVVTLFFLLRDGPRMVERLVAFLPLPPSSSRRILDRLQRTIEAVFLGVLVTALFQGTIGALGFWLAGFESFALWGTMIALASFVPIFGTALIWVPATLHLLAQGHLAAAGGLVLLGAVISTSDNLLRLLVLHGRAALPALLLFLSIFGGLLALGPMGVVYGPLLAVVTHEAMRLHGEQLAQPVPEGPASSGREIS